MEDLCVNCRHKREIVFPIHSCTARTVVVDKKKVDVMFYGNTSSCPVITGK
jgi:hypothetical protein